MSEIADKLESIINDPEQLGRVTQMAKGLMDSGLGEKLGAMLGASEENRTQESKQEPAVSPELIAGIGKAVSAANADSGKTAILSAMKPYLAEKRQARLDRAMKLTRITGIARAVFGALGGGEDGV
jgi:hypothetical protein